MALGLARDPVHQHLEAVLRQQERGEHEPGLLAVAVGIGGPVDVHRRRVFGRVDGFPRGAHEAGELGRGLALVAKHQQEGAELLGFDLAGEHVAHGLVRLVFFEVAGQVGAAADHTQITRERMSLGHGILGPTATCTTFPTIILAARLFSENGGSDGAG
jgi:hypothetical protein